jgi:hypothetical protein
VDDSGLGGLEMRRNRREVLRLCGAALTANLWRAYAQQREDRRADGTSRVPKLKITEVRAVDLRIPSPTTLKGFEERYFHYVRVYTDQGLTGNGEMVDTLGAAEMINTQMGPSIVGPRLNSFEP